MLPKAIQTRCDSCYESWLSGCRHSIKLDGSKVILRCMGCGAGWAIDASAVPMNAPLELVIQSINNLIVNRIAQPIPIDPGMPDEEPT